YGSFFLFFPHLCSPRTAAHSFTAAAFHFYKLGIQRFQHFTRRLVNIIRTSQIATVVVSNALSPEAPAFFHFYFPFVNQLLQENSVVYHFITASQFGVFIF